MALSDFELIARARCSDQDAFAELVRRYQSPLRAWLRRLTEGDAARADDLAQEAFLRAYQRLSNFRGASKFSTWLFGVAYREFCRSCRRERQFVELTDELSDRLIVPDAVDRGGEGLDLDVALNALTVDQRAAITLCFQQGMTHEEAAAVLKCPLGTVKTNILRGKERLRRFFKIAEATL